MPVKQRLALDASGLVQTEMYTILDKYVGCGQKSE